MIPGFLFHALGEPTNLHDFSCLGDGLEILCFFMAALPDAPQDLPWLRFDDFGLTRVQGWESVC